MFDDEIVNNRSRQIVVRRIFGISIIQQRESVPIESPGTWGWGRWRSLSVSETVGLNVILKKFWR